MLNMIPTRYDKKKHGIQTYQATHMALLDRATKTDFLPFVERNKKNLVSFSFLLVSKYKTFKNKICNYHIYHDVFTQTYVRE